MPEFDYSSVPGFMFSVSNKLDTPRMHGLFTIIQLAVEGIQTIINFVSKGIEDDEERRQVVDQLINSFNQALCDIGFTEEEQNTLQSVLHGFDTLRNRVNNSSVN